MLRALAAAAAGVLLLASGCDAVLGLDHFSARTIDSPSPDDGLVAHYPLEDLGDKGSAGGGTIEDTEIAHPGNCKACPAVVRGVHGNALEFTGTERIDVPAGGTLETTNELTVAAWLRFDGVVPNGCPLNKLITGTDSDTWQLCLIDDGEIVVYTSNEEVPFASGTTLQVGTWAHVVLRIDAFHTRSILIDGALAATSTQQGPLVYDNSAVTFGADVLNDANDAPWVGAIDDVRIYARALEPDEIAALAAPP